MVKQDIYIPRIHVASIETCGCVADFDTAMGKLTVYMTTQAPHAIRTVFALVAGTSACRRRRSASSRPTSAAASAARCRSIPGYVIAIAASVVIGKPVKWIEDRMENLQADSFARDYHMTAELAAKKDGTMTGAAHQDARRPRLRRRRGQPVEVPGRPVLDLHRLVRHPAGLHRGGRRLHQQAAGRRRLPLLVPRHRGGARHRAHHRRAGAGAEDGSGRAADEELHPAGASSPTSRRSAGSTTAATTRAALQKAMDNIGYDDLRKEQAEKRQRGELMGIGISQLHRDRRRRPVEGLRHPRASRCSTRREIRVHPTGKAIARFGTKSQGQGHETTYAQIVAEELGIPAATRPGRGGRHRHRAVRPRHLRQPLDADRRARPARWPRARSARRPRRSPRTCSRCAEDDLDWEPGKFSVKGAPQKVEDDPGDRLRRLHQPSAGHGGRARGDVNYYDPPNLTFPFGSYICVVDIDRGTGEVKIRRFVAVDDCGNIINPMIVDGQIHGGLTMGHGAGAVRGDQLRRERQHPGRQLHGLPGADRDGDAERGRRTRRSRRRRTIRSARRGSASRRRWARRRRSPTRWWTRWRTWGCATSTSRSRRRRCG